MHKLVTLGNKSVTFNVTDPHDHIQRFWIKGSFYEAGREGLLTYIGRLVDAGVLSTGFVMIDAGAHMGNHSLYCWRMFSAYSVAFEPDPSNYEALCANVALNGASDDVKAYNIALSEANGLARIRRATGEHANSGMSEIAQVHPATMAYMGEPLMGPGGMLVECDSLDRWLRRRGWEQALPGALEFLKIDVENHVRPMLRGSIETLRRMRPAVVAVELGRGHENLRGWFETELGYHTVAVLNRTPTYVFVKSTLRTLLP